MEQRSWSRNPKPWLGALVICAFGVISLSQKAADAQIVVGPAVDHPAQGAPLAPAGGEMVIEDILDQPIELRIARDVVAFIDPEFRRRAGVFRQGTRVRLASMKEDGVRVRGRATHGDTAGWLKMEHLEAPDPELFTNLKAMYDRHILVADLIRNKQVALGMTTDEVQAALGQPTRKSSELTAEGRVQTFEYAIFERVPQIQTVRGPHGELLRTTIYIQVQTGNLKVSFKDNSVISISEEEGTAIPDTRIRIVPPPIILY